jgi:hypothetical protein
MNELPKDHLRELKEEKKRKEKKVPHFFFLSFF